MLPPPNPEDRVEGRIFYAFLLVVPDDRTAVGFTEMGSGVVHFDADLPPHEATTRVYGMYQLPNDDVRILHSHARCLQALADTTELAVVTLGGTPIYTPDSVWKHARSSNLFAEVPRS